ncbi:hypothetical protein F4Z98_04060 [Candidatus Poribacteria bacterium]|nr:hypothetical protein [Candidatus Poribacteria bacterium]MYC40201.1 hypothetical protein [Candidatus Dadabacteria bacterium]
MQTVGKVQFDVMNLGTLIRDLSSGATPKVDENYYTDASGVPFLRVQNVTEYGIDLSDAKFITTEVHNSMLRRSKLKKDDLAFTITGRIGSVAVIPDNFEGNINQHSVRFQLNSQFANITSPRYIAAFLNSTLGRSLSIREITGGTRPALDYKALRSLKVILPALSIQNDIIEIMQAAYTAKKQKDQEADAILDSIDDYMLAELGVEIPITEEKRCFVVYTGETAGRRIDSFYYQEHYKVLQNLLNGLDNVESLIGLLQLIGSGMRPEGGVANIESGVLSFGGEHINNQCEIEVSTPRYVPWEFHYLHNKTETQLNDLLLVKDGATTGKIGIVSNPTHIGQNINEHLFLLRTRDNVNPVYLLNFLNSCLGQLQIQREITGGTVTGITKGVVRRLKIIMPDEEKQTEIVNHITEIRGYAKRLQQEGDAIVEEAKERVERILLSEA